jgi:hypothetical protein
MPYDIRRYGQGWLEFSLRIKRGRARSRCECTGQCGLHQPNPIQRRCCEIDKHPARWFRGRVVLTTAHTCTCNPPCQNPTHVLAMCQRCHLRVDAKQHAANRTRPFHPSFLSKS